ncbi:hypothetical protein SDC9_162183 [bioreactor metagenome]|uniref:Uncharacterized protein n=1 Tax=bioreactor metagenome TaxID=1076179 RepID=A0A645FRN4_9ZZZZ
MLRVDDTVGHHLQYTAVSELQLNVHLLHFFEDLKGPAFHGDLSAVLSDHEVRVQAKGCDLLFIFKAFLLPVCIV